MDVRWSAHFVEFGLGISSSWYTWSCFVFTQRNSRFFLPTKKDSDSQSLFALRIQTTLTKPPRPYTVEPTTYISPSLDQVLVEWEFAQSCTATFSRSYQVGEFFDVVNLFFQEGAFDEISHLKMENVMVVLLLVIYEYLWYLLGYLNAL